MEKEELIIVKAGTDSISQDEGSVLDHEAIGRIAEDLYDLLGRSILVSSASIAAGTEALGWDNRPGNDEAIMQQIASARGNRSLFEAWEAELRKHAEEDGGLSIPSVLEMLVTKRELDEKETWDNVSTVVATALEFGELLPGFNDNDVVSPEELFQTLKANGSERTERFGDNDQLAMQLAVKIGAFALSHAHQQTRLVLITDVDGVLEDKDRPDSLVKEVSYKDANMLHDFVVEDPNKKSSRGGMHSKIDAAIEATSAGITTVIASNHHSNPVHRAIAGESGTTIQAATTAEVLAVDQTANR